MTKPLLLKEFLNVSRLEPVAGPAADVEDQNLFADEPSVGATDDSLRPDGSHDGLDDYINAYFDQHGATDDDSVYDPSMEVNADDVGSGLDMDAIDAGMDPLAQGDELAPELGMGEEPQLGDEMAPEMGEEGEIPGEDPNFQGSIRTVRGACLVYKRKDESDTFEELWIFNVGKGYGADNSMQIRKSILAGTDIADNNVQSEDGTQEVRSYSVGNVQYLQINGLPN